MRRDAIRRRKFWRYLLAIILIFGVLPLAVFPFFENRLIFFPEKGAPLTPAAMGLEYEDVFFDTEDGLRLHSWYIPPTTDSVDGYVLFLHGNAGNVAHFLEKTAGLARLGFGVMSPDYRGFGLSEGKPSEKGVYLDSRAAFETFIQRPGVRPENVVIFGYSLGGAAAAELALEVRPQGVIFESTFTSIRDMAHEIVPLLPRFMVSPVFETAGKMSRINAPALFIHGDRDELVPSFMGRRLYELHPGPKDIMIIPGGGHTDGHVVGGSPYLRKIREFILKTGGPTA